MSSGDFDPAGSSFGGIFGDIAKLLGSQSGPMNFDIAREIALLISAGGKREWNADPATRIRLEELAKIARLHVEDVTGISVQYAQTDVITSSTWASRTIDDYKPVLELLAHALRPQQADTDSETRALDEFAIPDSLSGLENELRDTNAEPDQPTAPKPRNGEEENPFGQYEQLLAPIMLGMQVGGMIGHESLKSLAQFDIPIPRKHCDQLVFVASNIEQFASAWNLPLDEVQLYVTIEELTRLAILHYPHVRERFVALITDYVQGFQPNNTGLMERIAEASSGNPASLPDELMDDEAMLAAMQTPSQLQTLAELEALTAVFVGYIDFVVDTIARRIVPSAPAIREAHTRRRVEESKGDRLFQRLLGMELTQRQYDRGSTFVKGLLERAGTKGVLRLWQRADELPTVAEVDAPGLWLARIGFSTC